MKNEGQKAFYLNDLAKALKFYKAAIEVDPTYDTVYNNIGTVYFYLQQYTNTVQYWERAVLLDPDKNNDLFLSLAGVYDQYVGNMEKALHYYTEYLKRNPKDPQKKEIRKKINTLKERIKISRTTT
jgi:tetratricopeptide (TPR) repeat protein